MISAGHERRRQVCEETFRSVFYLRSSAMPRFGRPHDSSAECGRNGLMAEANAKDRKLAAQPAHEIDRTARVGGSAWSRRQHNRVRLQAPHFTNCGRIVAHDMRMLAEPLEIAGQIVHKAIVVV